MTWTQYSSPALLNGGGLAYDADHHLLVSSNEYAGFWRRLAALFRPES
jgi:hypothetical protein